MKVLVTGANGQIGSLLCSHGARQPHEYLGLTHQALDICSESDVANKLDLHQPDVIINAAAYTQVDNAELEREKALRVNSKGPEVLAFLSAQRDIPLVHLSTDYVFDGKLPRHQSYTETHLPNPVNAYGYSKAQGEASVLKLQPKSLIIRSSWVFSEHQPNFITRLLAACKTALVQPNPALQITDQYGTPTYAADLTYTIFSLINKLARDKSVEWGIYHYAGYPSVSRLEWAHDILTQAHRDGAIASIPDLILKPMSEIGAQRPMNSSLDCQKIKHAFNISPSNWRTAIAALAMH